MKPFRKNVALAVDGGGIKGVVASKAISILEDHLGVCNLALFLSNSNNSKMTPSFVVERNGIFVSSVERTELIRMSDAA